MQKTIKTAVEKQVAKAIRTFLNVIIFGRKPKKLGKQRVKPATQEEMTTAQIPQLQFYRSQEAIDADEDQFFQAWEAEFVPASIAEAAWYGPNREEIQERVINMFMGSFNAESGSGGLVQMWISRKGKFSRLTELVGELGPELANPHTYKAWTNGEWDSEVVNKQLGAANIQNEEQYSREIKKLKAQVANSQAVLSSWESAIQALGTNNATSFWAPNKAGATLGLDQLLASATNEAQVSTDILANLV